MIKEKSEKLSISSGKIDLKKLKSTKKNIFDAAPKETRESIDDEDGSFQCICCGKKYKKHQGNFPKSSSILFSANLGYVPFCFTCLDNYYKQTLEVVHGDDKKAIERVCQLCDWFYCDEVADMLIKTRDGQVKISLYSQRMNIISVKQRGTTYQDTIKEKDKNSAIITHKTYISEISDEPYDPQVSQETVKFFGYGYEPWQYQFLQDQYNDWVARYECKTKAQEEIFKNICIAQLNINLSQQGKSGIKAVDAQKAFQDLLGSGNLKPSQNTDSSASGYPFGVLIEQWEKEKPIPEPDPELQDVDNIKKNYNTWIVGHLCKLLHIQSDNASEYEEEISQYTAYKPTINDGDSVSPSDIFDKYKESSSDGSGDK